MNIDFTGKLHDIQIDYKTKKPLITFLINQNPDSLTEMQEDLLSIKIGKNRKKRSLDSNAYFHVLCDKLRQKMNLSMASCKNEMITSYGQILYLDDGEALVYKTNAPPEFIKEREEVHMKYIKTGKDGAHWYRVYRGSHTYNSEEMAKLIEGTIAECKDQNIETATPDELKKMAMLWEQRRTKNDPSGEQHKERSSVKE